MTNSGDDNNIEETVAEVQDHETDGIDETAMTESGEISISTDSNEIFSDSAPGEASSAAGTDADDGKDVESGKNDK